MSNIKINHNPYEDEFAELLKQKVINAIFKDDENKKRKEAKMNELRWHNKYYKVKLNVMKGGKK